MMAKENRSKYAVLGMLATGPMSGYDIKQTIETSIGHFWNESYGQIYPILKHLTEEGLATRTHVAQANRPDRYVYTLTEQGHAELRAWLETPVERPPERIEILLRLVFGQQVPVEVHIRQLERYRETYLQDWEIIRGALEHYEKQDATRPEVAYWKIAVEYGRLNCEAMLRWCEESLAVLHNLKEVPDV
jgi:PadR family transcriptional regulator AphA